MVQTSRPLLQQLQTQNELTPTSVARFPVIGIPSSFRSRLVSLRIALACSRYRKDTGSRFKLVAVDDFATVDSTLNHTYWIAKTFGSSLSGKPPAYIRCYTAVVFDKTLAKMGNGSAQQVQLAFTYPECLRKKRE